MSLVQRSASVYFAEHKFDRCQTCFCLIRAASVPLLKILNVLQGKYLQYVKRYGSVRDLFNELDKEITAEL